MASISVIVPCYKVENYLDRCMDSLLKQQVEDMEIILVDDCSPDSTPAIADAYAEKHSHIKVIHKPANEGLGMARNTGLDAATGEYIAFIDSDDFINPSMYVTLLQEAKENNADAVFCNFLTEEGEGVWIKNQEVTEKKTWKDEEVKEFMLDMIASAPGVKKERRFQMSVWHAIYRREVIESSHIRFHSEREILSEDFPFHVDFLLKAKKICFIPDFLYHWCLNYKSLTATFSPDKFERTDKLYALMRSQLKDCPEATTRLQRFYIGYIRGRICNMLSAKHPDADSILHRVTGNSNWKIINKEYPLQWLPPYQRVFQWCIKHKQIALLHLFYRIATSIKILKRIRH